jgi:hypothetical protein
LDKISPELQAVHRADPSSESRAETMKVSLQRKSFFSGDTIDDEALAALGL